MTEQISQRELHPLKRQRFVAAQAAVDMFRHAPALDWSSAREDIDEYVDQDIEPRG